MGQINTNNYPIVDSLLDDDLLIVENATHGTGTTTPKQLRENAIGTDPLQTSSQTVTGAINELKNSSGLPETPLAIIHGGTGNTVGYIQTGRAGNTSIGAGATAEGGENEASGEDSHAEGSYNVASGDNSHAEGHQTTASDLFAHAEGYNTTASEDATHAEGNGTTASELYAHAEGHSTTASGEASHAEGASTTASSTGSHAEGVSTTASGNYSHAGGATSVASGSWSFAHGVKVTAGYDAQSVFGNRNNNKSNTLFEVGNGRWDANTGNDIYSNAFEVYRDGKASWDNGASKFQFTQNNGADGYYDASGTFHAFGSGGSGNTKLKTRYSISYSSWSSSPNNDGYYTYSLTLSPTIDTSVSPDVLIAGSSNTSQPTDTHKTMFGYVERCYLSGSSLTLYAKTKPTSTFYIWVEGVAGSGSGSIVGNVIQPNGASGGSGEVYSTAETVIGTWKGQTLYRKIIEFGTLPNNNMKDVSTGFGRYAIKVVNTCVICRNSANVNVLLPFVSTLSDGDGVGAVINFRYDNNNGGYLCAEIQTNFDATQYTECDVIMEYIKV